MYSKSVYCVKHKYNMCVCSSLLEKKIPQWVIAEGGPHVLNQVG